MEPRITPDVSFEQLVAIKAAGAATATLWPYVTEWDVPPDDAIAVGNTWTTRLFGGAFYVSAASSFNRPTCSLVFVQSRDGNTVAADPADLGGGDTDKHLIYEGLSRVAADAVLAGAGTVRGSRQVFSVWHPELVSLRGSLGLPRHPIQIVATFNGIDLDDALLFNLPELRVVLVTGDSAAHRMRHAVAARPWVTLLPLESSRDLHRAFAQLLSMGIARISCIGGRTLAGHLLDARLVDDVYLTTGTRDGGEAGTPVYDRPWRGPVVVRKHGTGAEEGVVFEHLRTVRGKAGTSPGSQAR